MMTLQERILRRAGKRYKCVENTQVDGTRVITVCDKDSDRLLLNYEFDEPNLSINIIDRVEGSLVDDYDTDYTSDTLDSKIDTAISMYESISKSYASRLKALREQHDPDIENAGAEDKEMCCIDDLSACDLLQYAIDKLDNEQFEDDALDAIVDDISAELSGILEELKSYEEDEADDEMEDSDDELEDEDEDNDEEEG